MTFDDGILTIFREENTALPGEKPKTELKFKERFYFGFETLGYGRYYTAKQARERIDFVVHIGDWPDVRTDDICRLEDGGKYIIRLAQPTYDDGLKVTRLSLERMV